MNKQTIIIATITLALLSCNKKTLQVAPLQNTKYTGNELVYSLPRNIIHIKVDVTKTTYIPGPYAAYAKKQLGISNAILERSEEFAISNIEISKTTESDPNALYVAFDKKKSIFDFFNITTSGLILPIDKFTKTPTTQKNLVDQAEPDFIFSDITSTPFIAEEQSVYYSKIAKDSSFVRVPIQKKMIVERNMEEKAKEAADFIFSLRKKRTEFFTNDLDNPLDGLALKSIFCEIDKLEESYLSLFIGKTVSQTQTKYFSFTPSNPEGESTILFRYSTTKGIVETTDFSGNPVLLDIKPETTSEIYNSIANAMTAIKEGKKSEFIYYRIPISATITISDGKTNLITQRELIYQYGKNCMIPISQIKMEE